MDTICSESVGFNPAPALIMHIDLNSCFATIEQQANPRLRGMPLVVAAYATDRGCVLTASREAKALGVKTGMSVAAAKSICPDVVVRTPDPEKYRFVNRRLVAILSSYTEDVEIKSIDEMVMNFIHVARMRNMEEAACEIKKRIKEEIGDWLTVSIGISTNRYLAKIASGIHKPDGLDTITEANIRSVLSSYTLEQLCGIKKGNGTRLRYAGITTPDELYDASIFTLRQAFASVVGYHWWLRLHGWEADDRQNSRKSFGQSYALSKQYPPDDVRVHQILCQLVEKMSRRMRKNGYTAGGIHVACLSTDYSFWHKGKKLDSTRFASADLYSEALKLLDIAPRKPVRILSVSCYFLQKGEYEQGELFVDRNKKRALVHALDTIWDRWGDFAITPARMLHMEHTILDRIAFGGVE